MFNKFILYIYLLSINFINAYQLLACKTETPFTFTFMNGTVLNDKYNIYYLEKEKTKIKEKPLDLEIHFHPLHNNHSYTLIQSSYSLSEIFYLHGEMPFKCLKEKGIFEGWLTKAKLDLMCFYGKPNCFDK